MGLREVPGADPGAEPGHAVVRHRGERAPPRRPGRCAGSGSVPPRASSRRKCDLPVPLAPSTATRSPYQISRSNGKVRPSSSSCSQIDRALAGPPAAEPHPDVLVLRRYGRRPGLLELAQPGLRGLVARGQPVVVRGLLLVHQHQLAQLLVLLVPAPAQLVEAVVPGHPRLVPAGEAARVHPGAAALDGDHPVGGLGQQLPVVRDVEHRLRRLAQPRLQPALAGHVEEVVRLVEQQHLVRCRAAAAPGRSASAGRRTGSAPAGPGRRPRAGRARSSRRCRRAPRRRTRRPRPRRPSASAYASWALPAALLNLPRGLGRAHGLPRSSPSRRPASRSAGGASDSARSASVDSSPIMPMNWRITPSPPARAIAPLRTGRSPATILSSVVLPAPFGPTRATLAPSPTRNDTSAKSSRPSGQDVPDRCHVHVSHAGILPEAQGRAVHPNYRVTRSTRKPFWLACRSTCQPSLDQPAVQRVAAEVPGHDQPADAVRGEPGQPAQQQVVQLVLADPDRRVGPDLGEADVVRHLVRAR